MQANNQQMAIDNAKWNCIQNGETTCNHEIALRCQAGDQAACKKFDEIIEYNKIAAKNAEQNRVAEEEKKAQEEQDKKERERQASSVKKSGITVGAADKSSADKAKGTYCAYDQNYKQKCFDTPAEKQQFENSLKEAKAAEEREKERQAKAEQAQAEAERKAERDRQEAERKAAQAKADAEARVEKEKAAKAKNISDASSYAFQVSSQRPPECNVKYYMMNEWTVECNGVPDQPIFRGDHMEIAQVSYHTELDCGDLHRSGESAFQKAGYKGFVHEDMVTCGKNKPRVSIRVEKVCVYAELAFQRVCR